MYIMTLDYCNKPLFDPNLITAILLCFKDKLTNSQADRTKRNKEP